MSLFKSITRSNASIVIFMLFIVFVVIAGPFVSIWALNTLFPVLAIPYNFFTWVAMVIVHLLLKVKVLTK